MARKPKADPVQVSDPLPLCGAKTDDGKCKNVAGHKTEHVGVGRCYLHGGASPQAEVTGVVWLAKREAMAMGVPLDIDPHNAILECIRIAAGEVAYASEKVQGLTEGELLTRALSGDSRPKKMERGAEDPEQVVTESHLAAEDLNIWIKVRHEAMDRLVKYSATAIRAGVEERAVEIAKEQGEKLVQVIRGVLAELGVKEDREVAKVVRKQLTIVAGQG